MELTIHDVGHGGCITLVHENGNVMMWDCGHNDIKRPSNFLPTMGISSIDYFFVTNYDEDHISDLPELRNNVRIKSLYRNKSLNTAQLRSLKEETAPISNAMNSLLDMIDSYNGGPFNSAPEFPGVTKSIYYHDYSNEMDDTNNLSLVTFLQCNTVKFIFPGDLETKGWAAMLRKPSFISDLSTVDIFIASHHGRENGYYREVFDYCRPDVVVMSDGPIKYATQEMANIYGQHASGINFNNERRYVLTTRNDGSFTWTL